MARNSLNKKTPQGVNNPMHNQSQPQVIKTISIDASKTLDSKDTDREGSEFKSSEEEKKVKAQNKRQRSKSIAKEDAKSKGKQGAKPKSTSVAKDDGKAKRKLTKVKDIPKEPMFKDASLISDDEQDKKPVDVISNSGKEDHEAVDVSPEDEQEDVAENVDEEEVQSNGKQGRETKNKKVQHVHLEEKPANNTARMSKLKADLPPQKPVPAPKQSIAKRTKQGIQCESIGDVGDVSDNQQVDNNRKTRSGPAKSFAKKTEQPITGLNNRKKKSESNSENLQQFQLDNLVDTDEAPQSDKPEAKEQDVEDYNGKPQKKRGPAKAAEKQTKLFMEPVKGKSSTVPNGKKKRATVRDISEHSEKEEDGSKVDIVTALAMVFKIGADEVATLMEKYEQNDRRVRDHLIASQLNKLLDGDKVVN